MKTHKMLLLAFTIVALAVSHRAMGVTCLWTNALPANATVNDLLPDGKGGVIICFSVAAAAGVRYIDKNGVAVWEYYFMGATEAYADYISSKQVIVTVYESSRYKAYECDIKTGSPTAIANTSGSDFTFGPSVPTPNKDSKGFFLIRRIIATGDRFILRYSYK